MKMRQAALEIGELIRIEVESLNYSARAVGRAGGLIVFVNRGVPGDKLLVRIEQIKKNYAVAEVEDILSASPYRCQPPCVHFTEGCGGCQWQHIAYKYQLQWKMEVVRQALKRIGKLEIIPKMEHRGLSPSHHYRNKLRLFPAKDQGIGVPLGMRRSESHKVVPIRECLISTTVINSLSSIFRGEVFSTGDGLSEISIRSLDGLMLSCTYNRDNTSIAVNIDKLSDLPEVASIFYRIVPTSGRPGKFILGYGGNTISQEVHGIRYKIGPDCFFQINVSGLKNLIHLVKDFAGEDNHLILDAHCGVGTFALQVADVSDTVWGIDISSSAVALARSNASDNGITNVHFRKGRASDILRNELRDVQLDLAILDPPRKGCEKADLQALIRSQPRKIIYVSCNPTTLARDLRELGESGYNLLRLAMVDMFPMTYHLEVVALCTRMN